MPARSTIYEVARRSGVSTATVSRVMRGGTGFGEKTRIKVLAAAEELGWVPNHSARSLASRAHGILGVLFPDVSDPGGVGGESPLYVDQIIRGAEQVATEAGGAILIAATRGRGGRELARSITSMVDGLVIVARSLPQSDIDALADRLPVVFVGAGQGNLAVDVVAADNRGGSERLTTHLIRVHHYEELAFVSGPADSPDSKERFTGFCRALRSAGYPAPTRPQACGGFTETGGEHAIAGLLDGGDRPRAVVFGNDEMALGALPVLRRRRIRVPSSVAVTGFDDILSARHVRPGLTTVRQPMREMGRVALSTLLARLERPSQPRQVRLLPVELVRRSSCGCPLRQIATR